MKDSSAIAAAGGRVELELAPQKAIAAHLPAQALRGLQNNPNVEYVEVDAVRYPLAQSTPWGIPYVQADNAAFAVSNASNGAMVCIIDSGYQMAHEDLQNTNVTGTNDSGTGNWNEDSCGHGSHVAGTIAALNNSVGVVGVNKNGLLKLHIEKVFTGASCGWAYSSTLVTALNRCQAAAGTNKLVVSMSQEDGLVAVNSAGSTAVLDNTAGTGNGYEAYDGTSMATPHVSGVAALVWSLNSGKTNAQIRDALVKSAIDKGTTGRDTSYGYGIVQAKAAHDLLQVAAPPPAAITLTVTKVKVSGSNYTDLRAANSTASGIDVYRNGAKIVPNTGNDGLYRDGPLARGTYTYKVCDVGSTTSCSPSVTVKF